MIIICPVPSLLALGGLIFICIRLEKQVYQQFLEGRSMAENYWDRVNFQQITEFILHGVECAEQDPRPLQKRLYQNNSDFVKSLHVYSRRIQNSDWTGLTEEERIAQDEDLYTEAGVNEIFQNAISIAFEMGVRSGLHLRQQSDLPEEG